LPEPLFLELIAASVAELFVTINPFAFDTAIETLSPDVVGLSVVPDRCQNWLIVGIFLILPFKTVNILSDT